MNEKEIEQEIDEKALNAPRITPAHIGETIAQEHYFTAFEGVLGNEISHPQGASVIPQSPPTSLETLTFCVLILRNGFTVTGESACASPENFNVELGRKIAKENARNKIWALEGYLLKQSLATKG